MRRGSWHNYDEDEGVALKQVITCDAPGCERAARGYIITSNSLSTHVDLCTEHSEPLALVMSWGRPGQGPDAPKQGRRRRQRGEDALGSMPFFDDDEPANGHTSPN